MKEQVDVIDATPHKRFILSIVSDYDLTRSICELIDNALDIWTKNGQKNKLIVNLNFDDRQRTISIKDNAGGVPQKDLAFLISPGATTHNSSDSTIGIFGVGTKRAVIALSEDVKIITRHKQNKTYAIEFDKDWLMVEDWHLPYFEVDPIEAGTTIIQLHKLLVSIDQKEIKSLEEKLGAIYSKFLSRDNFLLKINSQTVVANNLDNWAYPPKYEPRRYFGNILTKEGRTVSIEAIAGLMAESTPFSGGEYGVYFYCNDRLIASGLKSPEVGFVKGIAGSAHPTLSITRVIISLKGAAIDMPWNSSKSNINVNHYIFDAVRNWLLDLVKNTSSLSRRLHGTWDNDVFPYKKGVIKDVSIGDFSVLTKAYLVELPPVNIRYADEIKQKNSGIEKVKPWTKGLAESVVAVEYISKQRFETKNRISLILLDSNLEIAFKEYLVNDSGKHYSDKELLTLFGARHMVVSEIKKYISSTEITPEDWKKIRYYYDLRCKLVHERATINITDSHLKDYRGLVEKVLKKLFKLKF